MSLGPAFTIADLLGLALFVSNYAVVAPVSALCVLIGFVTRNRRWPTWLIPIAGLNVLVALPQLVLFGVGGEWWFSSVLGVQTLIAIGVIVWVLRRRDQTRALE